MSDLFAALGDPTRRHVIEQLAVRESVTASELARELPITRQAVSKHLAVLDGAGLLGVTREGREVRYRLRAEPLEEAAGWLATVGGEWDSRLARLRRVAQGSDP